MVKMGKHLISGVPVDTSKDRRPELDLRSIAEVLSSAPGVEKVLVASDEDATHVWSVVNHLPPDQWRQVYQREDVLLDKFPNASLDFHVIDRRDAPADGLVPGARAVFAK